MFLMICPTLREGGGESVNFFEIISFIAEVVGLLSDLNELLTTDTNANLGIILFGLLRNKKRKEP
ncbi:Uncharacterised protein [Chlamydia trachomatis]|nr:Uncharacterised protein [Chlamydia trachomatis]